MSSLVSSRLAFLVCCSLVLAAPMAAQEMYGESLPYGTLPGDNEESALFERLKVGYSNGYYRYAPLDDVIQDHPAQVLTCFLPVPNPAPNAKFPAVIYCTAGGWKELPPAPEPPPGFLMEAVEAGYVVITVGTTGFNSYPTCSQYNECTPGVSVA